MWSFCAFIALGFLNSIGAFGRAAVDARLNELNEKVDANQKNINEIGAKAEEIEDKLDEKKYVNPIDISDETLFGNLTLTRLGIFLATPPLAEWRWR